MRNISFSLFSTFLVAGSLWAQVTTIKENLMIFGGIEVNSRFVFAVGTGQLGYSDGSSSGTQLIDANKVLLDFNALAAGLTPNRFFFTGTNSTAGSELWYTDGTDEGTVMVKDIRAGATGSGIEVPNDQGAFPVVNDLIYFLANDGIQGKQLWKSNGTAAGTQMVKIIRPGGDPQVRFPDMSDSNFYSGNYFYFVADDGTHGSELWRTNGTEAGTHLVADITPGPASTQFGGTFLSICGTLVFAANNGITGMELWKTNGTAGTTMQLSDIAPGSLSAFKLDDDDQLNAFTFRNKIYFTAFQGGVESWSNEQMWVTDGSPAGTKAITSLNQSFGGFHAALKYNGGAVIKGGRFLFLVNDYNNSPLSLWASDGTANGTLMIKAINNIPPDWGNPNYRRPVGRVLMPTKGFTEDEVAQVLFKGHSFFMIADDGVNKRQLWISDGTTNGTKVLIVNPYGHGIDSTREYPEDFYYYITSEKIFFTGVDAAHGMELWSSDGTQAGTQFVYDARPGPVSSDMELYGIANGKFLFYANDGTKPNLYRFDGQIYEYFSGGNIILCPGGGAILRSNITGSQMVWQANTPSGWVDLSDNASLSGTNSATLVLSNMSSSAYGWEFRCVVDGNQYSNSYKLQFLAFWAGSVSSEWENPANWHCGAVPDANTDVLLQCSFGNVPIISSQVSCRRLFLLSGQSLSVNPGGHLTVTHPN
ncbi:MAG: hypothetical protein MUE99_05375 [Chitinophagaceae bacterium]|nr:hypothetical protein [Chitinophagaceae bacterium]